MNRHRRRAGARRSRRAEESSYAEVLQVGLERHQAGSLAEAEACYGRVLAIQPNHPEALQLLGIAAHQTGRYALSVELISRAIRQDSQNPVYLSNLAAALEKLGRYEEAVSSCRRAIRIEPRLTEAYSNLGTALRGQGRLEEAVGAYRQAIQLRPHIAEAHVNLGATLRVQGKLDDAVKACKHAIKIKPSLCEGWLELGAALHAQGKLVEACASFKRAICAKPDYAEAYFGLGSVLRAQGEYHDAIAAYRDAVRHRDDFAEAHCSLGALLYQQGKLEEAVAAWRQAARLKPDYTEAYSNLGVALHAQGKLEEAAVACRKSIALNPNFADAHNNIALVMIDLGRISEGRASLQQAIRLAPRNVRYRRNLAEVTRFVPDDPRLSEMKALAEEKAPLPASDQIDLHFALAKAYDDVDQHAEAFQQWLKGNSLKRRQISYNESATLGTLNRIQSVFTPEMIRSKSGGGQPSSTPIFVVGMLRSGTTLVEQILASHPKVFGGGELTFLQESLREMQVRSSGSAGFPNSAPDMSPKYLFDFGASYLREVKKLAPDAARIVDKMPGNFILIGLIQLALPNAGIIHVSRDPIDTCVSCFCRLFGAEQDHTYDLAELGRYYRHYAALMEHWNRVLPKDRVLNIRYEELVADLEAQARRIIGYSGLDWDPRCLAFHETDRPVRTASALQVRQPIYNSSVGRWRKYEPFLGPLLAELSLTVGARG
jgi:tetratricopeptide (TPR) repeat protein